MPPNTNELPTNARSSVGRLTPLAFPRAEFSGSERKQPFSRRRQLSKTRPIRSASWAAVTVSSDACCHVSPTAPPMRRSTANGV